MLTSLHAVSYSVGAGHSRAGGRKAAGRKEPSLGLSLGGGAQAAGWDPSPAAMARVSPESRESQEEANWQVLLPASKFLAVLQSTHQHLLEEMSAGTQIWLNRCHSKIENFVSRQKLFLFAYAAAIRNRSNAENRENESVALCSNCTVITRQRKVKFCAVYADIIIWRSRRSLF